MTRAVLAPAGVWAVCTLCACSTPTPQIVLGLAGPPTQACPGDCGAIPLPCDAVMSIRIVDPGADPGDVSRRHLDQCAPVHPDNKYDVCSLAQINLDSTLLPVRELAVQIAVFPGSAVQVDARTGKRMCPNVAYSSATGFPIAQAQAPVLGRQAFYHPGDTTVNVALGCTDLSAMQAGETCQNPAAGAVIARVDDFDTGVPVAVGPDGDADNLFVWAGEPHILNGAYVLNPPDVVPMRLDNDEIPRWTAEAAQTFATYACVEVLEDLEQTVAAVRCAPASDLPVELTGVRIRRDSLQAIVKTVSGLVFPPDGLTIGMVVDATATGVGNVVVTPNGPGRITYLSGMGDVGGDSTFKNGIFVSEDAPFGTMFSAPGALPAIGGLVMGKATIVILPLAPPTH